MEEKTIQYAVRRRGDNYTLERTYLTHENGDIGFIKDSSLDFPDGVICKSKTLKGLVLKINFKKKDPRFEEMFQNMAVFTGAPIEDEASRLELCALSPQEHADFWRLYRGSDYQGPQIRIA